MGGDQKAKTHGVCGRPYLRGRCAGAIRAGVLWGDVREEVCMGKAFAEGGGACWVCAGEVICRGWEAAGRERSQPCCLWRDGPMRNHLSAPPSLSRDVQVFTPHTRRYVRVCEGHVQVCTGRTPLRTPMGTNSSTECLTYNPCMRCMRFLGWLGKGFLGFEIRKVSNRGVRFRCGPRKSYAKNCMFGRW